MSPGYSTSSFLHSLTDKDHQFVQGEDDEDAGNDCGDESRAFFIRSAAAEDDLGTERTADGQQEAVFSRRRSWGQLNPKPSEHRRSKLHPNITRRFSQQEKPDKGTTTRRRSHGDRNPPVIRFISSSVHIVYGSDGKQKQDAPGVLQKILDNNLCTSDIDCKRSSQPAACDKITGSQVTAPYHRANDDGITIKSKGDIADQILAPLNETSDATSKWFAQATTDLVSSPIPDERIATHKHQAPGSDGPLLMKHRRNSHNLHEPQHLDPAVSQWTACRALLSHGDDDDDDNDDVDGDQDDEPRALLHDLENMSVLSQVYAADDEEEGEEEEREASSKSRGTSASSSLQVPVSYRGAMSDADMPSSLGWIHDQASGRLSRMTSLTALTTVSGRARVGGGGGRKRRPLLLPPIMLPPIYCGKPTPLVVRDELWFARASGVFRNRPVSDQEWDRLWDCRYLRIPRRPTTRDAIKV